eukprot:3903261-Amphidinium_carterae.1
MSSKKIELICTLVPTPIALKLCGGVVQKARVRWIVSGTYHPNGSNHGKACSYLHADSAGVALSWNVQAYMDFFRTKGILLGLHIVDSCAGGIQKRQKGKRSGGVELCAPVDNHTITAMAAEVGTPPAW